MHYNLLLCNRSAGSYGARRRSDDPINASHLLIMGWKTVSSYTPRMLPWTHIAWDIGVGAVSRPVGAALDAVVIEQNYSRLAALEDAIHVILDRGQHSGDRGQQLPSTASRQRITELNAARKMDKDIATTSLKFQLQTGGQQ
jgi:hypothetical protein